MADDNLQKEDAVCITCKREKDQSPFTFEETVQFQRGVILEGIDRGVSLIQILERLVSETPLSGEGASSEAIIAVTTTCPKCYGLIELGNGS